MDSDTAWAIVMGVATTVLVIGIVIALINRPDSDSKEELPRNRCLVWKTAIRLPYFEALHEVCHAFFRTSEQGEWKQDEWKPGDQFVLHYIRGAWKAERSANHLTPQPLSIKEPSAAPMELEIRIRPAPTESTLFFCHRLHWHGLIGQTREYCAEGEHVFSKLVYEEMQALAGYFQQVYSLPEPPRVENKVAQAGEQNGAGA